MTNRPVFSLKNSSPFYEEEPVTFTYYSGFADSQRKRSSESIRKAYLKVHTDANVLEVSRFSDSWLGQRLSAFNLMYKMADGSNVPVENVFQSSKVFTGGNQYLDLLSVSPVRAKKDERIKNGGKIYCFKLDGVEFPIEPKTYFYDWIYINALNRVPDIKSELLKYNAFTDIVFNPDKSINCQARTVAIFVSLCKYGKLYETLKSPEVFKKTVYCIQGGLFPEQMSFY